MTTLQTRIDQVNAAEIWWRDTGYNTLKNYFADLCRAHLAGKKVFKVDGKLTAKYETERLEVQAALQSAAPKNVQVLFYAKPYGVGQFYTLQMCAPCKYWVSSPSGEGCAYVPWYLSLDFTEGDLNRFLERTAPDFEPLTVESVEGLRAAVKTYKAQISDINDKLAGVKDKLSVLE